ncbi:hypothetical protein NE237_028873 [Protea cynaroides]|uniref:Uncharacterized protein n=1 Tax=Protea cynaroides TaxID=273540 RepID=A0A9Q0GQ55_9MAGN|nr:hypothetical protein NE237_028873 [Protea cynaroides]
MLREAEGHLKSMKDWKRLAKAEAAFAKEALEKKRNVVDYFDIPLYVNEARELDGVTLEEEIGQAKGSLHLKEDLPLTKCLRCHGHHRTSTDDVLPILEPDTLLEALSTDPVAAQENLLPLTQ